MTQGRRDVDMPLPPIGPRGRRPRGSPVERAQNARGTVRRLWNYFQDQRRPLLILADSSWPALLLG